MPPARTRFSRTPETSPRAVLATRLSAVAPSLACLMSALTQAVSSARYWAPILARKRSREKTSSAKIMARSWAIRRQISSADHQRPTVIEG